ncbi:hypothetical protein G9A89_009077 [Geosiphon pyriformis]|nr:hypothetical protein G9A89_009077 [Geosiphon pyriformis]
MAGIIKNPFAIILFVIFLLGPFIAFAANKDEDVILTPLDEVELHGELVENPFNLVTNGQKTKVLVTFNNKGHKNYTVRIISGALVNSDNSSDIIRSLPSVSYDHTVPSMDHADLYYSFHSEFRPQDLDLIISVAYADEENNRYKGVAFNSTVRIVEPEQSLFDLQLLFLYFLLACILGGVGFVIYQAFMGGAKARRYQKARAQKVADKQAAAAAIELTQYDEKWIPENHLKPQPQRSMSRSKKKDEKGE